MEAAETMTTADLDRKIAEAGVEKVKTWSVKRVWYAKAIRLDPNEGRTVFTGMGESATVAILDVIGKARKASKAA